MFESRYPEAERHGYRFVEQGDPGAGRVVVLLHGMIGGPGNWDAVVPQVAASGCRVLVPRLPVFQLPRDESTVPGLVEWVVGFLDRLGIERPVVAGNSLGGHVAALLALTHPDRVGALVLVGSSGVHELDMGMNTMRRNDRAFIREKAEITFHDPHHVTESLVDAIIETINDRNSALRLIRLARSAKKETLTERLHEIGVPTLVVWGRQDAITPPDVAETLSRCISGARLHWIDACGHAPMMERPEAFNAHFAAFLESLDGAVA